MTTTIEIICVTFIIILALYFDYKKDGRKNN